MKRVNVIVLSLLFVAANTSLAMSTNTEIRILDRAQKLAKTTAEDNRKNLLEMTQKPSEMSRADYKQKLKGVKADLQIRLAELKSVKNPSQAQNLEIVLLGYDVEYLEVMSK